MRDADQRPPMSRYGEFVSSLPVTTVSMIKTSSLYTLYRVDKHVR